VIPAPIKDRRGRINLRCICVGSIAAVCFEGDRAEQEYRNFMQLVDDNSTRLREVTGQDGETFYIRPSFVSAVSFARG
jgi:hypothetical protein